MPIDNDVALHARSPEVPDPLTISDRHFPPSHVDQFQYSQAGGQQVSRVMQGRYPDRPSDVAIMEGRMFAGFPRTGSQLQQAQYNPGMGSTHHHHDDPAFYGSHHHHDDPAFYGTHHHHDDPTWRNNPMIDTAKLAYDSGLGYGAFLQSNNQTIPPNLVEIFNASNMKLPSEDYNQFLSGVVDALAGEVTITQQNPMWAAQATHGAPRMEFITIDFAEGMVRDWPETFTSWESVDRFLSMYDRPEQLGVVNKVNFTVRFSDGFEYRGRIDLYHKERGLDEDLNTSIRKELAFWAGIYKPPHMTAEDYQNYIQRMTTSEIRSEKEMVLNKYFGGPLSNPHMAVVPGMPIDVPGAQVFDPPVQATIYFKSEYGPGITRQEGRLVEHGKQKWAQYESAPFVDYIPKGRRKRLRLQKGYKPYVIVLKGWKHPEPPDPMTWRSTPEVTTGRSRYLAHAPEWEEEFDLFIDNYIQTSGAIVLADYRHTGNMRNNPGQTLQDALTSLESAAYNANKELPIATRSAVGTAMMMLNLTPDLYSAMGHVNQAKNMLDQSMDPDWNEIRRLLFVARDIVADLHARGFHQYHGYQNPPVSDRHRPYGAPPDQRPHPGGQPRFEHPDGYRQPSPRERAMSVYSNPPGYPPYPNPMPHPVSPRHREDGRPPDQRPGPGPRPRFNENFVYPKVPSPRDRAQNNFAVQNPGGLWDSLGMDHRQALASQAGYKRLKQIAGQQWSGLSKSAQAKLNPVLATAPGMTTAHQAVISSKESPEFLDRRAQYRVGEAWRTTDQTSTYVHGGGGFEIPFDRVTDPRSPVQNPHMEYGAQDPMEYDSQRKQNPTDYKHHWHDLHQSERIQMLIHAGYSNKYIDANSQKPWDKLSKAAQAKMKRLMPFRHSSKQQKQKPSDRAKMRKNTPAKSDNPAKKPKKSKNPACTNCGGTLRRLSKKMAGVPVRNPKANPSYRVTYSCGACKKAGKPHTFQQLRK